jgi:hypothetical protein
LTQQRHSRNGDLWEDLTYHYQYSDQANEQGLLRNRLYHVNDFVGQVDPNGSDLDDQGAFQMNPNLIETENNCVRDEQGRLISNRIEEIELIVWTASGKAKEIIREINSAKKNISFDFDAMVNQIAKHVYNNQTGLLEKSTYYILDAQGHQLSIYEHIVDYTAEEGLEIVAGEIIGIEDKNIGDFTVDLFVGSLVDNLSVGYKAYLKKTMPNIGEDQINEQLKNYGEKMTKYFTTLVKSIVSEQGKETSNE